jgi:hypothetical protein
LVDSPLFLQTIESKEAPQLLQTLKNGFVKHDNNVVAKKNGGE